MCFLPERVLLHFFLLAVLSGPVFFLLHRISAVLVVVRLLHVFFLCGLLLPLLLLLL